jgi:hypothetical protein
VLLGGDALDTFLKAKQAHHLPVISPSPEPTEKEDVA